MILRGHNRSVNASVNTTTPPSVASGEVVGLHQALPASGIQAEQNWTIGFLRLPYRLHNQREMAAIWSVAFKFAALLNLPLFN